MTEHAVASPKRAAIKTAPRVEFDLDANIPFNADTLTGAVLHNSLIHMLYAVLDAIRLRIPLSMHVKCCVLHVIAGKLANGMTYYCRQNSQPRNRAELRVAIKVGSLQESEHERGIAHLIEVSVHV
jgi:Insulinase (Peptidase family M16)